MSRNILYPHYLRVRLGTISTDILEKPVAHIFCSSKANWETIDDDLPKYDAYIP